MQPVSSDQSAATPQAPVSPSRADDGAVQWQAPEYLQRARTPLWYVSFWAAVIVLMGIAAFLIKSWSFVILVPVMAAALVIYSHRPPRQLNYVLSAKGLYINDQLHPLSEFRSFGVMQEESWPALVFIPVKRFRPGLTVYFPSENGEAIVDILGARIPMEELHLDAFDKIVRKLRM
ncbi:hypothetical protein RAAC3_TM7C00001G0339 [Candidatus Saccharibacteria bacterium RAAC3_TM7_1]|nr:hypothetical protein RAAC3_TM7C00001G0339 [Candidatus Saccharibacteria bacterium RAAC3_TM7_1]HCZ28294.1 hypothetical protein [Candidatus Saccharibacteria bacterium]